MCFEVFTNIYYSFADEYVVLIYNFRFLKSSVVQMRKSVSRWHHFNRVASIFYSSSFRCPCRRVYMCHVFILSKSYDLPSIIFSKLN